MQSQRIRGLFQGLRKSEIPYLYINAMIPEKNEEHEVFEFDLAVGTWVDGEEKSIDKDLEELEQRASILAASLSVAMPEASIRRLSRNELSSFISSILFPSDREMPQKADPSSISTVQSFGSDSPSKNRISVAPSFYVPNISESSGKIVIGNILSGEKEVHQLKIRFEDMRRHVTILGMTGSGKTTTSISIMSQVASIGLPVLILDWHNEYRKSIASLGGKVFSPGVDDFILNPLSTYSSEIAEHIAIVTDIFSDIYHFTHPQAYMFRNALQRCISEARDEPILEDLVRVIESFPLRSAYDNETKVALLRRLVPLTQGQVGKAMNGHSSISLDELLASVACLELGHMRDIQSRSIFTEIALKMLYEFRTGRMDNVEHLTVVEEARNIAPARRDEDPPSVGERIVSELRKFGESMVFVAQFPTQLASEIIKNSAVRIVHRIAWHEDMDIVANSLGLNQQQKEYLGMLEVGDAIVSLARLPKPILVRVKQQGYEENRSVNFSSVP